MLQIFIFKEIRIKHKAKIMGADCVACSGSAKDEYFSDLSAIERFAICSERIKNIDYTGNLFTMNNAQLLQGQSMIVYSQPSGYLPEIAAACRIVNQRDARGNNWVELNGRRLSINEASKAAVFGPGM